MPISVLEFLDHPGRRFPVCTVLEGSDEELDGVRTVAEISLDGYAFAQLSTLYLDVDIVARILQPCGRCLAPMENRFRLHETFTVSIPPQAETVDVRPAIIQLVLSAHDSNVVCRPDCRGLCPTCGVDLNEHPDHAHPPDEQRSRPLKDLLER